MLHEGWRGAMTPFLLAIALDCVYQLITVRFVYPLELLFTATLLALVPYALLRGPFNRLARLFLPAARPPPDKTSHNNQSSLRKHIKEGSNNVDESKTQDWSKPAAMAIPKGGYFEDKVEQGRYGPIFPKTPACYGFSILAKIIPVARTSSTNTPKISRIRRGAAGRPGCPAAALPALGALSHQRGHLLHVPGHFRHRLR